MSYIPHHHARPRDDHARTTRGRVIRWARYYDPFVSIFTLGRRAQLRRAAVDLARIQPGATVAEYNLGTGATPAGDNEHSRFGR
jgi:ubiquinone/menaquinone biosynthesis C-methylase UbiE